MIHCAAPSHELRAVLHSQGQLSLREEGVLLALTGKTPLEEVLSVTQGEEAEDPQTRVRDKAAARRGA